MKLYIKQRTEPALNGNAPGAAHKLRQLHNISVSERGKRAYRVRNVVLTDVNGILSLLPHQTTPRKMSNSYKQLQKHNIHVQHIN